MASRNKSTTVRSFNSRLPALRWTLRALSRLSPTLAARYVERLFFTPRRFARPAWEEQLLESAARFALHHEGQRIPAYRWGAGPTVLLVHGWEGRGTQLGSFVQPLVQAGYRVVALDLPGHGDAADARTSVVHFARALSAVIPQLGSLHAIIAHSAGAGASVLAYTVAPYDARLVLLAPPRGPRTFFDGFAQLLLLPQAVKQATEARMAARFGRSIDEVDVRHYGARVPLHTLVLHDRSDKDVPFSHGQAVAETLPNAQLVATEGLGHRRILREPDVIARVLQFVTQAPSDYASNSRSVHPAPYFQTSSVSIGTDPYITSAEPS